jgi:SAM-dependent methyltransferase
MEASALTIPHTDAIRTEPVTLCPLCGSGDVVRWRRRCADRQQPSLAQRYDYDRCRSCGCRYLVDRPLEDDVRKIYFEGYGPYIHRIDSSSSGRRAWSAAMRLAAVAGAATGSAMEAARPSRLQPALHCAYQPTAGGIFLDYGCGSAAALDDARSAGWSTVGVDFSDEVLASVAARGHRTAKIGEDFDERVEDASVALARMNHVVEHLPDVRATLAQVRRKLGPGGALHISTPNPASLGSAVFRRRWLSLEAPRHFTLLPPRTLLVVLQDEGFAAATVHHEVVTKDLARSWGYWLVDRGHFGLGDVREMGHDPVVNRLLRPMAKVAAVGRAADRYHVLARA